MVDHTQKFPGQLAAHVPKKRLSISWLGITVAYLGNINHLDKPHCNVKLNSQLSFSGMQPQPPTVLCKGVLKLMMTRESYESCLGAHHI